MEGGPVPAMRSGTATVLLLAWLVASTGCLDLFGRALKDHDVARTPIDVNGWNRDGLFTVQVREVEAIEVRIEAVSTAGHTLQAAGLSNATLPAVALTIPDGTWTLTYFIDGARWESFKQARFDSTPPTFSGLEGLGTATSQGTYEIGVGMVVEPGATVQVVAQATGQTIATTLPHQVTGLTDGLHAFDVIVRDAAGNEAFQAVKVRAGSAQQLPAGQHTLGLVARYTLDAELWDITGLTTWVSPSEARAAANNQWLGTGTGITPSDPAVTDVVASQVQATMSTGSAALALFQWMANELDYDTGRLDEEDLLDPAATIANDGGVCRDLAGLYVSLLRAAGIPARLVTGYLGGTVDGFHAWVEFYGGTGHGPSAWVPVDVSAIGSTDRPAQYSPDMALQAFAIRHTNMLPLRVMSETQEDGTWSTAVSVMYSGDPAISLAKDLRNESAPQVGVLCVDRTTLARLDVRRAEDCPRAFPLYLRDFERSASVILDYGATIQANRGTTVTLTLAYPDAQATTPGLVEQQTYGAPFQTRPDGTKQAVWTASSS